MKLIIAGGRDITIPLDVLDAFIDVEVTELVNGMCPTGIDLYARLWAAKHDIPVTPFPADWSKGKWAGPARNAAMAAYGDALVAIWDGKSRGTKSMIAAMKELGKPVTVVEACLI